MKTLTNKQVYTFGTVVDSWPCDVSLTEGGAEELIIEHEGATYSVVVKDDEVLKPQAKAVIVEFHK